MTRTEIINTLIDLYGHKSYLEIGVDNPAINFNKIVCNFKIGVDPNPRAKATRTCTSDQFFSSNGKKFDCIFIDGLHHHDQVIRDIENALAVLNENGTIIVHDCNPTTKEMQEVPRSQGIWTGDVWKAWVYFRARPNLNMCVLDTDYGVGVIRRGKQDPLFITEATYEQFAEHKKEWLNLIPVEAEPISICIPAFEQYGKGVDTLTGLLSSIEGQKGTFEVIVSDNSDGALREVCDRFNVSYYHNPIRGISQNTNFAMSKARYPLIKPMYQDDFFTSKQAIQKIAFALKFDQWVASASTAVNGRGLELKRKTPVFTDRIITGMNTLGMPSVVAFRKTDIDFDPNLKTLCDCDFYYRMEKEYGKPGIIKRALIAQRYWEFSTSRQQGNLTKEELPYVKQKHSLV